MKKILSAFVILAIMLSFVACGSGNQTSQNAMGEDTTSETNLKNVYQIGETASTDLFDFTLKSVSFLDKIKDGQKIETWYQGKHYYRTQDAVANEGYKIVEIKLSVDYHGKKNSSLDLESMTLNYDDGYTFNPTHGGMQIEDDNLSGYYTFNENLQVTISDPLAFEKVERTIYIVVNDVVEKNISNPLVLTIDLPTENGKKTVEFDLR